MVSELQDLARRLEQQIISFEKLHADEMKRFQEQFETIQRLQNDELQMLRKELKQLQDEVALLQAQEPEPEPKATPLAPPEIPSPRAELTITRRELITGNLRPNIRTGS